MTPSRNDAELLQAVSALKAGERVSESSEIIVKQFKAKLLSYFSHHGFSLQDSEDLVQETLRRVFKGIGALRQEDRFAGWLFQIARNVRMTAHVSSKEVQTYEGIGIDEVDSVVSDISENPLAAAIYSERLERTWQAIEKLPAPQKQCLIMRARHEMSYEEIATVLRLSIRTVRNHLREARLRLREEAPDA